MWSLVGLLDSFGYMDTFRMWGWSQNRVSSSVKNTEKQERREQADGVNMYLCAKKVWLGLDSFYFIITFNYDKSLSVPHLQQIFIVK